MQDGHNNNIHETTSIDTNTLAKLVTATDSNLHELSTTGPLNVRERKDRCEIELGVVRWPKPEDQLIQVSPANMKFVSRRRQIQHRSTTSSYLLGPTSESTQQRANTEWLTASREVIFRYKVLQLLLSLAHAQISNAAGLNAAKDSSGVECCQWRSHCASIGAKRCSWSKVEFGLLTITRLVSVPTSQPIDGAVLCRKR